MKLKDKKIQILTHTNDTNDNGFPVTAWRPIDEGMLWAYYRQLSGREFYASAMLNNTEDVVFTINWRNDLDTNCIVKFRGVYYYTPRT